MPSSEEQHSEPSEGPFLSPNISSRQVSANAKAKSDSKKNSKCKQLHFLSLHIVADKISFLHVVSNICCSCQLFLFSFFLNLTLNSATYDEGKLRSGETCPDRKLSISQPVAVCWGGVLTRALNRLEQQHSLAGSLTRSM